MQKRTSGKDVVVISLLLLIALLIILSMVQRDREWQKLTALESSVSEQSRDISAMRGSLNTVQNKISTIDVNATSVVSHNTSTVPTPSADNAFPDAFKRARAATEKPDYAQGDWSVTAFGTNLKTITPLVSTDVYASSVQSYILESLLAQNPDTLGWSGLIAKSWQVSEDGLTISFQLKENVTFSDGEPLDASDVVFSFNFIMDERIQAPRQRAYYEKIESVTANGPYEVVFTYKEPYFEALPLAGTLSIMPEHFYKPYLDNPQDFNESKGLLLGSGPYQLKDPKGWTPDQGGVSLTRNSRYWGPVQPSYDRILWKIIQNDSARLTTFRNGDIDAYGARPIEYQKLKDDPQIQKISNNFEYTSPIAGYSYLGWNQEKAGKPTFFADKRVRQAMTYLTDRKKIIDEIYLGYAEAAISPFSPRSKQHDLSLKPREYNLEKAQVLLKEAGFSDNDGNGIIEDAEGTPFEFDLIYFKDSEDTKRMVLLLKDIYAKAGIKMKPSPQEWPIMLEKLDRKDFDAITLGWSSGVETDIFQMFHSSQTKTNGDNFIGYRSEKLDTLIDEARGTVDEEARMPLWQEAERVMYDEQPYTFLTRRKTLLFIDKRIHNLEMTKLGLNTGSAIYPKEQYVPKAMQKYAQ